MYNNPNSPRFAPPAKGISKSTIIWICVGVVLLFLFISGCTTYNSIKKASIEVDTEWGNVQAQYQRRYDLFPNLVATVKGAAAHERNTLQGVTEARVGINPNVEKAGQELIAAADGTKTSFSPDGAVDEPDPAKYARAERAYGVYINAVAEAYPQITASDNFKSLQAEISGTENRISTARTRYNTAVKEYNMSIATFPRNVFASLFGFNSKQAFQSDAGAERRPDVSFE